MKKGHEMKILSVFACKTLHMKELHSPSLLADLHLIWEKVVLSQAQLDGALISLV